MISTYAQAFIQHIWVFPIIFVGVLGINWLIMELIKKLK